MRVRPGFLTTVAVVFAVAGGVALGAGPLSRDQESTDLPVVAAETTGSGDPTAQSVSQARAAAYGDTFASAVAGRVYAGGLARRDIALIQLPGADQQVIRELVDQVAAAGGEVSTTYTLADQVLDPGSKSLVDTLGSQLTAQTPSVEVGEDVTTYDRLGVLLASAASTDKTDGDPVRTADNTITASLVQAKLLEIDNDPEIRASLILVVLGSGEAYDEETDPIVESLMAGLSQGPAPLVVGADAAAADGGSLTRLRSSSTGSTLTTVDGIDGSAGRTTAVLALIRVASGQTGGAFGAAGAQGAVPLG